jgi:terminase large subunit-like protein
MKRALAVMEGMRYYQPRTKRDLCNYVKVFLGIKIPDRRVCAEHYSPLDYLWYVYSRDLMGKSSGDGDAVVWANRGGGKTMMAAVATLLDVVFKPGCQGRILGGSLEQSSRMYKYFVDFVNCGYESQLAEPVRSGRCSFSNGAGVHILSQSNKSVRGEHVQKLRCDEAELFDEDVFAAAKFITKSTEKITAGMEVLSTMHRPYGLMRKIIAAAEENGTTVFKWCVWEVIEKCVDRSCGQCKLNEYCMGRAKDAAGYFKIDDCISQMRRSSKAAFETEMLCMRPSLDNAVFAEFDPAVHVKAVEYNEGLLTYRAMDFGFVNPFVCLWIQVDDEGCVYIIDEYVRVKATIGVHAKEVLKRTPCTEKMVAGTFCDPSGAGRNDVTGTSPVKELRAAGMKVRYKKSSVLSGIELVRHAIRSCDGVVGLVISPKCVRLIGALRCYHYPDASRRGGASEVPEKDGVHDHPIDALRYFFVGVNSGGKVTAKDY